MTDGTQPKIMPLEAENAIRGWWYSQSAAVALTSKEAAAGIAAALEAAGMMIVSVKRTKRRPFRIADTDGEKAQQKTT